MKKLLKLLMVIALSLTLFTGCGDDGEVPVILGEGWDEGRVYNAFALAATFTLVFDAWGNWHSDNVQPWGTGVSTNSARFVHAENDRIIEMMRTSNPVTEEGRARYQHYYLEWVRLMNYYLPEIPLYANDIHDLFNAALQNFDTSPLWRWTDAIVEAYLTPEFAEASDNTFVVGNENMPGDFIRGWGNAGVDANVRRLVTGGGLLTYDRNLEMQLNFMTESMVVSEDQSVWTFTLRQDIVFSDGVPMTAHDVAFTFRFFNHPSLIRAAGSAAWQNRTLRGFQDFFDSWEFNEDTGLYEGGDYDLLGVTVLDDFTIQFEFDTVLFGTWTIFDDVHIMPKHYYAPDGVIDVVWVRENIVSAPRGAGPFAYVEFEHGQFIRLVRNDYFPGSFYGYTPSIENLIIRVVPPATDIDQLLAGDVDLLAGVIEGTRIEAGRAADHIAFNNFPRHGYGYIRFHTDVGAAQFVEFRQAFAHALDRYTFNLDFIGGWGTIQDGPFSLNYWMIDQEWVDANLLSWPFDPAAARALLEDAGWEMDEHGIYTRDGYRAVVNLAAGTPAWADSLNLFAANMIEESGIQLIVHAIDFAVLLDHFNGNP